MRIVFFIWAILYLPSCNFTPELQQSIFISDSQFPELPAYTEWGYNTFGAHYNGTVFISNDLSNQVRVTSHADTTTFEFWGQLGPRSRPGSHINNNGEPMSMTIAIGGLNAEQYKELITLDNTTIDLTLPNVRITVDDPASSGTVQVSEGTLYFKRAQDTYVDDIETEVILSGTFEFQGIVDGRQVNFSDGRFDFAVSEYNFYFQ